MKKILSPVKAIKKYCLECSGGSPKFRELCNIEDCPLYPYRLGKNPNRKNIGGRPSKIRGNQQNLAKVS